MNTQTKVVAATDTDISSRLEQILFSKNKNQDKITKVEQILNKRISGKTKFLFDKAMELAEGVYILRELPGTEGSGVLVKFYKAKPDLEAIKYLIDRLLGKPVARVEKKEEKKGLIVVETIIKSLAQPYALPRQSESAAARKDIPDAEFSEVENVPETMVSRQSGAGNFESDDMES